MLIQALDISYRQIITSDLIQTTVYKIKSLIYRIFINPSDLCLVGHSLTIGFLSCFDITPGGIIYYSMLFEIIFFTIQEAKQLYHSISFYRDRRETL